MKYTRRYLGKELSITLTVNDQERSMRIEELAKGTSATYPITRIAPDNDGPGCDAEVHVCDAGVLKTSDCCEVYWHFVTRDGQTHILDDLDWKPQPPALFD